MDIFTQGVLSLRNELRRFNIDEQKIASDIKADFARNHTLIYNNETNDKDNDKNVGDVSDELLNLDSKLNHYRAIFSVKALNEGWDVLSLFDIVHFDISENKKVKSADIQLIGRGARYYPFEINMTSDTGGDLFENTVYGTDKFKRKFDQAPNDCHRLAEQLCYHFVKTGIFHEELSEKLKEAGIINDGTIERKLKLKSEFIQSQTYQHGFVLINSTQKRQKTRRDVLEATFDKIPQINTYRLYAQSLTDKQENEYASTLIKGEINLVRDFPKPILKKALVSSGQNFFRFANLKKHLPEINSIDDFIRNYLSRYQVKYLYEDGKQIENLTPKEKLELLVSYILPEIKKIYSQDLPITEGSKQFHPVPLKYIFKKQKSIFFSSYPNIDPITKKIIGFTTDDEKAKRQSDNPDLELRLNIKDEHWYAYDESYGTSTEKKFVKYIKSIIGDLQNKFHGAEIYLVRNELNYWVFNPKDARRFSPDYLLFINDVNNNRFYYQCIFEVKGEHLIDQDKWKQEAILEIDKDSEVVFDTNKNAKNYKANFSQNIMDDINKKEYQEIRPLGFSFFTEDDSLQGEFKKEVKEKLLS